MFLSGPEMRNLHESELKPHAWLSEKSNHEEIQSIRDPMIRFLYDSEDHLVIEDIK